MTDIVLLIASVIGIAGWIKWKLTALTLIECMKNAGLKEPGQEEVSKAVNKIIRGFFKAGSDF